MPAEAGAETAADISRSLAFLSLLNLFYLRIACITQFALLSFLSLCAWIIARAW